MNGKLVSLFQREAMARLTAAEHDLFAFTRACNGKVVGLIEMNHLRKLRDQAERARLRHLRWTRYRFLAETGIQ